MLSSTLPRWWGITRNELHAVTLYQRSGEEIVTAAASNPELRSKVLEVLAERMAPQRLGRLEQAMQSGDTSASLALVTPADTFHLAAEFRRSALATAVASGAASAELDALDRQFPAEVNLQRLSRDFGTPHPVLAQNYTPELLNLPPFPAFAGTSSRLLGESWDSSNLYWARLVDEKGYSPVVLNRLVPELTRRMVANIFATDIEDWVALTRAMKLTGDEFRQGKVPMPQMTEVSSPAPRDAVAQQQSQWNPTVAGHQ